jgi:hypothetical protein
MLYASPHCACKKDIVECESNPRLPRQELIEHICGNHNQNRRERKQQSEQENRTPKHG